MKQTTDNTDSTPAAAPCNDHATENAELIATTARLAASTATLAIALARLSMGLDADGRPYRRPAPIPRAYFSQWHIGL